MIKADSQLIVMTTIRSIIPGRLRIPRCTVLVIVEASSVR
jgi:hypothetical protein